MSEFDFDEQLDRVLRQRAESEIPPSLENRMHSIQSRQRSRWMWFTPALAACLVLGIFLWSRLHAPTPLAHQTASQATDDLPRAIVPTIVGHPQASSETSRMIQHPELFAKVCARQPKTIVPPSTPLIDDTAFHLSPAMLHIAEHTAACSLIPCSCPEMCRVSD
jgi:hypothetical protein